MGIYTHTHNINLGKLEGLEKVQCLPTNCVMLSSPSDSVDRGNCTQDLVAYPDAWAVLGWGQSCTVGCTENAVAVSGSTTTYTCEKGELVASPSLTCAPRSATCALPEFQPYLDR